MLSTEGSGWVEGVGEACDKAARALDPANAAMRMRKTQAPKRRGMKLLSTPRRRLPATWLVGKKIRLRPVEPDDVPLLQRWMNDPPAQKWLGGLLPRSGRAEQAWAARASTDPTRPTFIIQTRRGLDIGLIMLRVSEAHAELGIGIHNSRYWDRGYGQDAVEVFVDGAFRAMPLHRIELFVLPDNVRAIRCYEKAGFTREGLLRKYQFARGKMRDVVVMSILHEEWMLRREDPAK